MKKKLRPLLAALCILFLALVAFSGWKVYSILHGYKEAERRYDGLAGSVVADAAPAAGAAEQGSPSVPVPEDGTPPEQPQEAAPREISPVTVDFEALRAYGGDVIGWICLPHTAINYPIAQARDNAYYLDRFLDGSYISGGTLFADYACPSDFYTATT